LDGRMEKLLFYGSHAYYSKKLQIEELN